VEPSLDLGILGLPFLVHRHHPSFQYLVVLVENYIELLVNLHHLLLHLLHRSCNTRDGKENFLYPYPYFPDP
tara:strand:- start:319 stop:534 length:216 start_codon:yes stop_codon:yes gene_type:complete